MRKSKKYILLVIAVIIACLAFYAYKEYNRKQPDLSDVTAVAKLSHTNLISEFEENEATANKKYAGKIIEVSGPVAAIDNQKDTLINILLGDSNGMHKVSCQIDPAHFDDVKKYQTGNTITLRGSCTGFLIDVELSRCVVINEK